MVSGRHSESLLSLGKCESSLIGKRVGTPGSQQQQRGMTGSDSECKAFGEPLLDFTPASNAMHEKADHRSSGAWRMFFHDLKRSFLGRGIKEAKDLSPPSAAALPLPHRPKRLTNNSSALLHRQRASTRSRCLTGLRAWDHQNAYFNRLKFFVWTGGTPGFSLTMTSGDRQPGDQSAERVSIEAITNIDAWDAGLRPGDVLESVSGISVRDMTKAEALSLVMTSDISSVLRFSSQQDAVLCTPERFEVMLDNQKLGVALIGDGEELVPVVHRIANREGKSQAPSSSNLLHLGDALVAVNDADAIALGIDKTMAIVAAAPRPMKLIFQRVSNDLCSSARNTTDLSASSSQSDHHHGRSLRFSAMSPPKSSRARSRDLIRSMIDTELSSPEDIDIALEFDDEKEPEPKNDTHEELRSRADLLIVWRQGPLGLTLHEDDITGLPVVNRLTGKGTSAGIERVQHGFRLKSVNGVSTERESFTELCKRLANMEKPVFLLFKPPEQDGFASDDDSYTFSAASSPSSSSSSSSSPCSIDAFPYRFAQDTG